MAANKIEMSLDDIIKAQKGNKPPSNKRGGVRRKVQATKAKGKGILRRGKLISKQRKRQQATKGEAQRIVRKQRVPKIVAKSNKNRNINNNRPMKTTTAATKRLVQKLVKKALAQSNVRKVVKVQQKPNVIRNKSRQIIGGGHIVKKTIILNRVSPRSRVISRRTQMIAQQQPILMGQGRPQIRYRLGNNDIVSGTRMPRRRRNNSRQFIVQQQPIHQTPLALRGMGIRAQIAQLRQRTQRARQQQQRLQGRPPQFLQRQQPQIVYTEQQPRRRQKQVMNSSFQSQQRQRRDDPFYEPPNFLQRIPKQSGRNLRNELY